MLARHYTVYDFMTMTGVKGGPPQPAAGQPSREMMESMARMGRNAELFLAHGLRQPAPSFLTSPPCARDRPRIVVAAGEESENQLAYRTVVALAERLGTALVRFPGDHGGFMTGPDAFAGKLQEVLASE